MGSSGHVCLIRLEMYIACRACALTFYLNMEAIYADLSSVCAFTQQYWHELREVG
jgi:hypothetical protein